MKKLVYILIAGMMLAGVLGSANATLVKDSQRGDTKYNVSHTLNGFNKSYDWPNSDGILKVGKSYTKKAGFRKAKATWIKQVKWDRKKWGHKGGGGYKGGGGKHQGVPEPGMLALMALVLLGLGLGPWLRKINSRSMQGAGF